MSKELLATGFQSRLCCCCWWVTGGVLGGAGAAGCAAEGAGFPLLRVRTALLEADLVAEDEVC